MTGIVFSHTKRLIISLLILFCFSSTAFPFQVQKKINGVVNKYARVTGIGTDYVIVNDLSQLSQFSAGTGTGGDTVLLMQMKGAMIRVDEVSQYGNIQDTVGAPGRYEFLIIQSINIPARKITFRNNLIKTYNISGDVQIIKTPSYNSAEVSGGDLTCNPWDSLSRTGGVLTMIVGRTLSLAADINVSGKGFRGGATVIGEGKPVDSNVARFDKYSFPKDSTNSGFKGESHASFSLAMTSIFPSYTKGKGANFSGGGGGNGRFAGGGGGANYGAGGLGGNENNTPSYGRGIAGKMIKNTGLDSCILFGAGGGSSTYLSGASPSPGGNGGGIVIIICDSLIGNSHAIKADGEGALGASGNAGAGGGGAGGSVALYLSHFSATNLAISANGGKGGNNAGTFGEGGGGGGGLVWINNIAIPGNVTPTVAYGPVGTRPGGSTGGNGIVGEIRTNYVAILNGFLFNSIHSSESLDQTDSICSNVIPKPIIGTSPVGGSGTYTYEWWRKNDNGGSPSKIAAPSTKDHTFSVTESDTFFIRRIVIDDYTSLTDTSKWVKIIVQPAIKGNYIEKDTVICNGQNPLSLIQRTDTVVAKGNGKYQYQWLQNLTNTNWSTSPHAVGPAFDTISSYDPPALVVTTYYQRKITSGRCIDYSPTATITVLPSITGNARISLDTVICEGYKFNALRMTLPGGGDGIPANYKYQWQDSISSGISYTPAVLVNTSAGYTPDTSTFAVVEQRFLRRVVYSGPDSVCQDRSLPVKLTRYHKIKNNIVTSLNDTIGYRTIPSLIQANNLVPGNGGNNLYNYQWEDSTRSSTKFLSSPGTSTGQNYQPGILTDTTWYRRFVTSDVCKNTSNMIAVFVHDSIILNDISLIAVAGPVQDTICSGSIPVNMVGKTPKGGSGIINDYAFQWKSSTTETGGYSEITGATGPAYTSSVPLTQTTYYRRYVTSPVLSPTSVSESNYIKITVHSKIGTNSIISQDTSVCQNDPPHKLIGSNPSGGNTGQYNFLWKQSFNGGVNWSVAAGAATGKDYVPPVITDTVKYKRFVMSGTQDACIDSTTPLTMTMNLLPTGFITPATDRYCEGVQIPVTFNLTEKSPWTVKFNDGVNPDFTRTITSQPSTIYLTPTPAGDSANYTFTLTEVIDNNKCKATSLGSGIRKSTVVSNPTANAGADVPFCGPEYQMAAVKSHGVGTWSMFSGPVPGSFDDINKPTAKFTADQSNAAWGLANIFKLVWREDNWGGSTHCISVDTVNITLNKFTSNADAGPDEILYSLGKQDTLHAVKPVTGIGTWKVISGGGAIFTDSIVKYLSTGVNEFEWTVVNGICESKDQKIITVYEIKVPEGFSPNGDGINDEFELQGLNTDLDEVTLRILNSAGTEVYFSTNANGGIYSNWNGENSNGILPEGTYYYVLTIRSKDGSSSYPPLSGFVILKRYNSQ